LLGHVTMVSPERPRSGFYLRHLPAEEAELIGLSAHVQDPLIGCDVSSVHNQRTCRARTLAIPALAGIDRQMTARKRTRTATLSGPAIGLVGSLIMAGDIAPRRTIPMLYW
jgi:hypothetical protein